jgi:hypothetical protein
MWMDSPRAREQRGDKGGDFTTMSRKRQPQWRTEGDVSYVVPHISCGLVAPSGKKWKAILLELTDDYHMGMQGMSRHVYRFSKRETAMKGLEIHIKRLHPEVTEILKADSTQSVSPADGAG